MGSGARLLGHPAASSLGAEGSEEFISAWPFKCAPGAKQAVR